MGEATGHPPAGRGHGGRRGRGELDPALL